MVGILLFQREEKHTLTYSVLEDTIKNPNKYKTSHIYNTLTIFTYYQCVKNQQQKEDRSSISFANNIHQ